MNFMRQFLLVKASIEFGMPTTACKTAAEAAIYCFYKQSLVSGI
jgi:hypothetical protein